MTWMTPDNTDNEVCEKKWKIALYQSQREVHTITARAAPGTWI